MIPEIADYEVRRELLRAGKDRGFGRLDALKGVLGYAPVTTPVMLKAAEFWARARNLGRQSATDASLAADMILAAPSKPSVQSMLIRAGRRLRQIIRQHRMSDDDLEYLNGCFQEAGCAICHDHSSYLYVKLSGSEQELAEFSDFWREVDRQAATSMAAPKDPSEDTFRRRRNWK